MIAAQKSSGGLTSPGSPIATPPKPVSHAELVARMKAVVGPDNVLTAAADLAVCDGIGPAKLDKYADEILDVLSGVRVPSE